MKQIKSYFYSFRWEHQNGHSTASVVSGVATITYQGESIAEIFELYKKEFVDSLDENIKKSGTFVAVAFNNIQ